MFILISPSSMAALHSIMVHIFVIFFLHRQGISANISAPLNQDVSSEIAGLKTLYLQQQSLIKKMKHKIEDQEMEIMSNNKKIEEQEQKLRVAEAVNRAQTKAMGDIQRVVSSREWHADNNRGRHVQKTNATMPISKFSKKREDRTVITLKSAEQVPAFYASLNETLSQLGGHQTIIFDHVYTNELNGYDAVTGIFTAPSNGVYVFSWTTVSEHDNKMTSELVIKGKMVGISRSDATAMTGDISASNTVVLPIHSGDTVWVRSSYTNNHSGDVYGNGFSTFSGWKLF